MVLLDHRLPRLSVHEGRIPLGHLHQPAEQEARLHRQRLLARERAVVVEDRDALLGRQAARTGGRLDELDDRGPGGGVVPGPQGPVGLAHCSSPRRRLTVTWASGITPCG
jgi:hypothetical protein